MRKFTLIGLCLSMLWLASCSTTAERPLSLRQALRSTETVTLPIHIQSNGLILIEGVEIEGKAYKFLMDTGATRSSIFKTISEKLTEKENYGESIPIYGISEVGSGQRITIPQFNVGRLKHLGQILVVLENRAASTQSHPLDQSFDGIVGMDILAKYKVHISKRVRPSVLCQGI